MSAETSLSPDQTVAFDKIMAWYRSPDRSKFFKLFGWAGTGKTTLASAVADEIGEGIVFGAYTGKAAQVLRRKTGRETSTLHRLAYQLEGQDKDGKPIFGVLDKDGSQISAANLLIVDECSMIAEDIMKDLLSFGCPILAIGDPGQLPPVKGVEFFRRDPDAMLDTIHRQAAGNPIIQLATKIRLGEDYHGVNGTVNFLHGVASDDVLLGADQMLCGTNKMRRDANLFFRKELGFDSEYPQIGERVVCLKNNHDLMIYNGETFTVTDISRRDGCYLSMSIVDELDHGYEVNFVDPAPFTGGDVTYQPGIDSFDFGYALTVNKAQGSEWRNVVLMDDKLRRHDRDFRRRWLYTGVTRASETLTIVE